MLFCLGSDKYDSEGEGYQKNYRVFNKDVSNDEYSKIKDSLNIDLKLTEWNDCKKSLDVYSYEDAWKNWWECASDKQKATITDIKYFDKDIFESITGIDVKQSTSAEQEAIELLKKNGYKIVRD